MVAAGTCVVMHNNGLRLLAFRLGRRRRACRAGAVRSCSEGAASSAGRRGGSNADPDRFGLACAAAHLDGHSYAAVARQFRIPTSLARQSGVVQELSARAASPLSAWRHRQGEMSLCRLFPPVRAHRSRVGDTRECERRDTDCLQREAIREPTLQHVEVAGDRDIAENWRGGPEPSPDATAI